MMIPEIKCVGPFLHRWMKWVDVATTTKKFWCQETLQWETSQFYVTQERRCSDCGRLDKRSVRDGA